LPQGFYDNIDLYSSNTGMEMAGVALVRLFLDARTKEVTAKLAHSKLPKEVKLAAIRAHSYSDVDDLFTDAKKALIADFEHNQLAAMTAQAQLRANIAEQRFDALDDAVLSFQAAYQMLSYSASAIASFHATKLQVFTLWQAYCLYYDLHDASKAKTPAEDVALEGAKTKLVQSWKDVHVAIASMGVAAPLIRDATRLIRDGLASTVPIHKLTEKERNKLAGAIFANDRLMLHLVETDDDDERAATIKAQAEEAAFRALQCPYNPIPIAVSSDILVQLLVKTLRSATMRT
jgi:hypothetical protein